MADNTTREVTERLANAYADEQSAVAVTFTSSHREEVLAALLNGEADAAILLSAPDNPGLFHTAVGREPVVIIANTSVDPSNLSIQSLRAIFSGEQLVWVAADSTSIPAQPIVPAQGSSTRLVFERLVMGSAPFSDSARIAMSEAEMVDMVEATRGGVGFIGWTSAGTTAGVSIEVPPVEGIAVDGERVASYPISGLVEFVSLSEPEGKAKDFLDWVLSDAGQAVLRSEVMGAGE